MMRSLRGGSGWYCIVIHDDLGANAAEQVAHALAQQGHQVFVPPEAGTVLVHFDNSWSWDLLPADVTRRGEMLRGSAHGPERITEAQVEQMRRAAQAEIRVARVGDWVIPTAGDYSKLVGRVVARQEDGLASVFIRLRTIQARVAFADVALALATPAQVAKDVAGNGVRINGRSLPEVAKAYKRFSTVSPEEGGAQRRRGRPPTGSARDGGPKTRDAAAKRLGIGRDLAQALCVIYFTPGVPDEVRCAVEWGVAPPTVVARLIQGAVTSTPPPWDDLVAAIDPYWARAKPARRR